ncbi:MAG: LamG domain-containing protein, partial [Anaerolineae bacterium]|nr:LamG domain-containing protein [Anaerolineae bacterium]
FWLTVNDLGCSADFPNNRAYTQEIGRYFAAHDPWQHLLSVSPSRNQPFCFDANETDWVSYIHLQGSHELDALWADDYNDRPVHVFLAEDYYEQDHPDYHPRNPAYFQRWLFWSWLLSGGSANYGGRYWVIHPYSQTATLPFTHRGIEWGALSGLDSVIYIRQFFEERGISLVQFTPDKQLVRDLNGENDIRRPQATVRGDLEEAIIYHPNAVTSRARAAVHPDQPARMTVDLSAAPNMFDVEWYRAADGLAQTGERLAGGAVREVTSPWVGYDVVLHLIKREALPATPPPQSTPTPVPTSVPDPLPEGSTVLVRYTFDEGEGSEVHDVGEVGKPLNLEITDMDAVEWGDGFLTVRQPTRIISATGANKIAAAVRSTNSLTVELWIRPENLIQSGPARIISYSLNASQRNFTLGQGVGEEIPSNRYIMRLRTTETDANGLPGLQTRGVATTDLTHIVYTRDPRGVVRLYVNSIFSAEDVLSGDLANWESSWPLLLANELDAERPWLGEYHFVAIYNYAMDDATITQRFEAGPAES